MDSGGIKWHYVQGKLAVNRPLKHTIGSFETCIALVKVWCSRIANVCHRIHMGVSDRLSHPVAFACQQSNHKPRLFPPPRFGTPTEKRKENGRRKRIAIIETYVRRKEELVKLSLARKLEHALWIQFFSLGFRKWAILYIVSKWRRKSPRFKLHHSDGI